MNQLEYLPGIGGQSVQLDGPSSFVGIAENLRSREWEYDLGYRDLVSATRPAREVDVTFYADYATADDLRRVADADVTARTPGVFIAQKEWRQRGYILASKPSDIHFGRLSTELKVSLLDGAWWRLGRRSFVAEDTTPEYMSATGKSVTTTDAASVPLHALTVEGESVQDGTPTPSSPVPVEVVQGRNLINEADVKHWNIANNAIYVESAVSAAYIVKLEANTAYTISFAAANRVRVFGTGDTVPAVGVSVTAIFDNTSPTETVYGFNSGNNTYALVILGVNYTVSEPQLEKGSTATPYTPYGSIGLKVGSTITPIDLQGNVLASLPDGTKDVLTVDSVGHVELVKRVGKRVFDSTAVVNIVSANTSAILNISAQTGMDAPEKSYAGSSGFCDRYTVGAYVSGVATPNNTVLVNSSGVSGTQRVIFYDSANTATKSAFSTFLTNNPVTVYYKLATPTTTDLGYIDMPNVFDGAVVSITAEVTPTITAEWQTSPDLYLDYPHNYPYDYQKTSSTESVTPSVLTPSDVHLVIYGPAVNPYVIVGENRYQVNVTVPAGGYLTVDGRDKTIMLTLADGTVQNVFSSGVRGGGAGGGSYIFERIPAGTSEVTYDGSFGFDLGWYEEEGEPPWSLS